MVAEKPPILLSSVTLDETWVVAAVQRDSVERKWVKMCHVLPTSYPRLTQRSDQSQASQGIEGTEHGTEGFDPYRNGAVCLYGVWTLRETPGLHQHYVLYSAGQRPRN